MDRTCLVYFSIGTNQLLYRKTIFSIRSYFAFHNTDENRVVLFTDDKNVFEKALKHFPVTYVILTERDIIGMKGEINFIHRVKIGVIEKAFRLFNFHVFYVDSDTFFIKPATDLIRKINSSTTVMHKFEYTIDKLAGYESEDPHRLFYNSVVGRSYTVSGKEVQLPEAFTSWNAGVIGIAYENRSLLAEVYELTDQMYPLSLSHACEQYAFSYILQTNTLVVPAENEIYHYWHRVQKQIADLYLMQAEDSRFSDDQVKKLTRELPEIFRKHRLQMEYQCLAGFWNRQYGEAGIYFVKSLLKGSLFRFRFLKDVLYNVRKLFF